MEKPPGSLCPPERLDGNTRNRARSILGLAIVYYQSQFSEGAVPSELGLMTTLTSLDITSNTFSGTLPTELGLLTRLTLLGLHMNSLVGTLPTELGQLTFLKELSVIPMPSLELCPWN